MIICLPEIFDKRERIWPVKNRHILWNIKTKIKMMTHARSGRLWPLILDYKNFGTWGDLNILHMTRSNVTCSKKYLQVELMQYMDLTYDRIICFISFSSFKSPLAIWTAAKAIYTIYRGDSMISAFHMCQAASGGGHCDIDRVLSSYEKRNWEVLAG